MPLISVKDGNFKEQFNISDTTPRRQKREKYSLTKTANFKMERDLQVYKLISKYPKAMHPCRNFVLLITHAKIKMQSPMIYRTIGT